MGRMMILVQGDALTSALIADGYPRFSSRFSTWADDAVDGAMGMLYPSAPSPDPWIRVGSERN